MEMSDNEVCIVDLQVERYRGEHYAREATKHKNEDEAIDEVKCSRQARATCPQSGQPAEDLDSAGDGDHHARSGEVGFTNLRQVGCEHVVNPKPESNEPICDLGQHHSRVAKQLTLRVRNYNGRNKSECWNENDVDLGMSEEPEDVLIKKRVSTFRRVHEVGGYGAVGKQVRACQNDGGHGKDHHE